MKLCVLLSKNSKTMEFFIEMPTDMDFCNLIGEIYNDIIEISDESNVCDFDFVKSKILEHSEITEIEDKSESLPETLKTADIQIDNQWSCNTVRSMEIRE